MSTRAQIKVEGSEILIYKHCDGYPDAVLPTLVSFCRYFVNVRGWDPEYLLAQCVREFARKEIEEGEFQSDSGWGLDCVIHDDTEYLYTIREGCIEVKHLPEGTFELVNF